MLKSLQLTGLFLLLASQSATAQVSSFNQVDLVCYMQTSDGRTVNLTSLCGNQRLTNSSDTAATTNGRPPLSPYTNLGNLDIYSGGTSSTPCFGLDAQGRPCSATAGSSTN
ncbi:MAG: hypothetical protein IGS54_26870 [Elainella sp. C42_A2020_010]|nr:hypothetical protein [Elainella sp. C42_A2020_010]